MNTRIVGVLNTSPESHNKDSFVQINILKQVEQMIKDGADIIDVGGQSTRPGSSRISLEEEILRTKDTITLIKKSFPTIGISIDTTRSEVARVAASCGASMINDISGGRLDPKILDVVREFDTTFVITHSQGKFEDLHQKYVYTNICTEVREFFAETVAHCLAAGISREKLLIDPGIGFSKAGNQNIEIINGLEIFHELNIPLYIGLSRKRFIGSIIGEDGLIERDNATTALHVICLQKGVRYIRTHHVQNLKQCIQITQALEK